MTDQPTTAEQLARMVRDTLAAEDHADCEYADRAQYAVDHAAVVCGCGAMFDQPTRPSTAPATTGLAYTARDPVDSALSLLDPTDLVTPDDVNRHILDVLARLETGALFERQTVQEQHAAQDAWDRAYWRAFHASTASSDAKRKADAMVQCDDAGLTQRLYEANMLREAVKSTMHNLRSILSGYQSVGRTVGATYQTGGGSQSHYNRT